MSEGNKALLGNLLKATSRSFYLTLRILPARVRPQIGLAYLLARTADTIADTEIIPFPKRKETLKELRERIYGHTSRPLDLGELAKQQGSPAKNSCWRRSGTAWRCSGRFRPDDLNWSAKSWALSPGGQEIDLSRFQKATAKKVVALESAADLDDYTYRVAGCVGRVLDEALPRAPVPEIETGRGAVSGGWHPVRQRAATGEHFARPAGRPEDGPLLSADGQAGTGRAGPGSVAVAAQRKNISCRFTTNISTRRRRISRRAGIIRTRCRSARCASGWPVRGQSSSVCGRLNICGQWTWSG